MSEAPVTMGIETSCDETAVAVLDPQGRILVNLLASQIAVHRPYGGVVPEIASREHLKALPLLVQRALSEGPPPGLVAVTGQPGLVGALLVGVRFAAAFAWARSLPLVAVDHLEGHLLSPFLDLDGGPAEKIPEPALALVASGGHSNWYLLEEARWRQLGRTRDDAAGEVLDKVAQALGLPYPGGPVVDRLARSGDPSVVNLPRPRLKDSSVDFSFSGLKSAAIRAIRERGLGPVAEGSASQEVRDLLAAFEASVVEQLLRPLPDLAKRYRPRAVAVSGGVAANTLLRNEVERLGRELGVPVALAPRPLTTDNAAMIARAGQLRWECNGGDDPRRLDAWGREAWQPPGMRKVS